MREVKYDAANKANTLNGNDQRDNLIRWKTKYNGEITVLFCTLQNSTTIEQN